MKESLYGRFTRRWSAFRIRFQFACEIGGESFPCASSMKPDTLRMNENTDPTQARIKLLEERLAKLETFVDAAFGALAEGGGFSVAQQDLVNVLSDGRPRR